ncbi:4-fold beta flower protein [Vibrio cholerae]|uniref:4-fold beta flower protein n=1 Tax=Vibrio cholerae TaxID=666 RepID=UPI0004E3818A|nr:hypothetical protein [Vibrio cholerae]EJL6303986.1 hypothetical protein [Vibrio cholerae]KFE18148.1 hypothetical protein DN39_3555 [Vibrio cholerae]TXZ41727.1 hypothetical protein FXE60_13245 [Vibrio cholerae]GHX69164.1 hypothetical protein VCSRO65_3579 [Vibrio cholerae]
MEVTLYDGQGKPVAYVAADSENSIYTWDGHAVAYITDGKVYGWNGQHLGWFIDGVIFDLQGYRVGSIAERCPYATYAQPAKYAKYAKYAAYAKPALSVSYGRTHLIDFLNSGAV